jgi:hypothetical protein
MNVNAAFHEAGHAVAMVALGFGHPDGIKLTVKENSTGRMLFRNVPCTPRAAPVFAAGCVAEAAYEELELGERLWDSPHIVEEATWDLEQAAGTDWQRFLLSAPDRYMRAEG